MDEAMQKLQGALEAVLFIYGEAISRKKLAQLLSIDADELTHALHAYAGELAAADRGLMLLVSESEVQLATKPAHASLIEGLAKEEFNDELTKAALETMAIVAYLGPISRAEVDYIRGVNSSFILRSLLLRKLVERTSPSARPSLIQYVASFDALRHLGIAKADELPDFAKYRELLSIIRKTPEAAEARSQ